MLFRCLFFLLLTLFCCSCAPVPDAYQPRYSASQLLEQLEGFRPPFPQAQARVLYLSAAYRSALDTFLGRAGGVFYQPYQPSDSLHQRLEKHWTLLGHRVAIDRSFGLLRAPNIRRIDLNETLTRARLHYSDFGRGGVAHFERLDGRWQLKSLTLSWIE